MPSEIIIVVIGLMFLGVNMFLALLRTHFSPSRKMSLSRAKNIFTLANINSIVIILTKIKTYAKKDQTNT